MKSVLSSECTSMLDAQPTTVYPTSPDDPSRNSKFGFWSEHHCIYFLTIVSSTVVAGGMKVGPTCRQRDLSSTTALVDSGVIRGWGGGGGGGSRRKVNGQGQWTVHGKQWTVKPIYDLTFKIKRKDSPLCSFCNKDPETYIHVFCECPRVLPILIECCY